MIWNTIAACAVVFGLAGVVDAATLVTAPLPGGTEYRCQAVNITARPREVVLAIFSANGGGVGSISCMGLQPGRVCTVTGDQFSSYCRVTVTGPKGSIRASLTALNGGIPAAIAPAQ